MADKIIAVTGGIGSGKSYVCCTIRDMGFTVIDTDSLARSIMDGSDEIKRRIVAEIHPEAVDCHGNIDRRLLAAEVFGNEDKLQCLNSIVHSCVRDSIRALAGREKGMLFVETAVFFPSGLNEMVDAEWRVVCPEEIRIERTMRRSKLSRSQVISRIEAQRLEALPGEHCPPLTLILNDGTTPIPPQILAALELIPESEN